MSAGLYVASACAISVIQTPCHQQGHSDTVEDVVFQPGSSTELASVANDSSLLFWDTRSGIAPVLRMAEAHGESDLHVVDWSALRPELVATGLLFQTISWQQSRCSLVQLPIYCCFCY